MSVNKAKSYLIVINLCYRKLRQSDKQTILAEYLMVCGDKSKYAYIFSFREARDQNHLGEIYRYNLFIEGATPICYLFRTHIYLL